MFHIEYETQKLALPFFMLMGALFMLQALFGLVLALQHTDPSLLRGVLNFNVARAEHLNLGVLWIITGFIGTLLWVMPLLSGKEVGSPLVAKLLLVALVVVVAWNMSTLWLSQQGNAGWWGDVPLLQEGLEYIEGGRITDVLILVGFLMFSWIVYRTLPPRREWNEFHWGIALGVGGLTLVWTFGFLFFPEVDKQEYFRWYIVHYWVEGVWEVIHITLVGFLLMKMFGASRKVAGYAVFWGVSLVLLSGLIGNGHHYFWVGTPEFWQFWGSFFSALEPLPIILCFWHIYLDSHHDAKPVENMPAFLFILGSAVFEQVGAGILGFTQTFALTNVWEHGTWVTASHGHLALFGTFGMLAIGAAYFAIPSIRDVKAYNQRLGVLGFWMLFVGIIGIALCFAFGGTVQIFVYRVLGLDWFGAEVHTAMAPWKALVPVFAVVFISGAAVTLYDLVTLGRRGSIFLDHDAAIDRDELRDRLASRPSYSARRLRLFSIGGWLGAMWLFGGIITLGLLSFNFDAVRAGDPTLPYVLAGIGYGGLWAVTIAFVARFHLSISARRHATPAVDAPEPAGGEPQPVAGAT